MHFERILKSYLFPWKPDNFKTCIVLECRQFIYQNVGLLNPCKCGKMVYHQTTGVKVLSGRSSNPVSE